MNFYSKSPSSPKPFGINSLPANSDGYVLPLYFESETSGPYTIELIADNLNNNNVSIYLHDNLNPDNDQNLKENPTYNFTHDISNDSQRFELLIGEGLGIENEQENSKITVYSNEKTLYINNLTDKEYKVEIIDLSGKTTLISHISGTGNSRIRTQLKTGIYIVRLSGSENVFNKKVFIK
ncbi:MAG: T9SS type A sorting domain-containing protein [Bacteroidota bacterium]|nr:T9SS type A sorting domain-containing protein [Bacteroidota bacterium]